MISARDCLELDQYFAAITISAEVGSSKPAPGIFDAIFEALGSPARERALMVGDSLTSDMAGGTAYGIDTCWFNPDRRALETDGLVSHEIARLGELVDLVQGG